MENIISVGMSRKNNIVNERNIIILGFILSFLHPLLLGIFLIGLLYLLKQNVIGAIKALLLITTRSLISVVIAVPISSLGLLKWALIFVFAFWIISHRNIKDVKDINKIKVFSILLGVFIVYSGLSALLVSSYPVVSIFKLISYSLVFFSVVVGVASTYKTFDWTAYLLKMLIPIFVISFLVIPLPMFRIKNDSLQGILDHPNMFGIMNSVFLAFLTTKMAQNKGQFRKIRYYLLLIACLIMIYLSESRTGMISAVTIVMIYLLTNKKSLDIKIKIYSFSISLLLGVYLIQPEVLNFVNEGVRNYLAKGYSDDPLYSRLGQLENFRQKFEANPFLGSGFGVPFIPNYQNFSFSFDLIVEPGNLILAVLGDTGIIGFVLFLILMIFIFFQNKGYRWILFVTPIIVSFGEMVFFSTNSIGIYLYLLFGIYMFETSN